MHSHFLVVSHPYASGDTILLNIAQPKIMIEKHGNLCKITLQEWSACYKVRVYIKVLLSVSLSDKHEQLAATGLLLIQI